jgi:hypothetical protein
MGIGSRFCSTCCGALPPVAGLLPVISAARRRSTDAEAAVTSWDAQKSSSAVRPASISAVSPLYEPENPLGHCYAMYVSGLTISGEHPNGSLGHSVATQAFELEHRATEAADDFC